VLNGLDTGAKGVGVVIFEDGDGCLGEDGAGVHAFVDQVDGTAGEFNAGAKGLAGGMRTWEGGEQSGVYIEDAVGEGVEEAISQHAHKPCQAHEVRLILLEQLDEQCFIILSIFSALMGDEEGGDAGFSSAHQGMGGSDVGDHQAYFSWGVRHIEVVDECLKIAAITRSQYSNAFH